MKRFFKRFIAVALCVTMLLCPLALNASATNKTSDEAINWVKSNLGESFGAGYCVDLICAYYSYLGETAPYIPAYMFSTISLPAGWTRTQGGHPQKGDILVFTNGTMGHVAIYESDYSTYHQNWSGQLFVTHYTGLYSWRDYWGCIHPNFADSSSGATVTSPVDTGSTQTTTSQTGESSSASSGTDVSSIISLAVNFAAICIKALSLFINIIASFR
ncbi:MAG: CHAP domain-containing protein [Clostridia bacterium]|nr:CHAP domain-containing protein [Clostridia bacterium]